MQKTILLVSVLVSLGMAAGCSTPKTTYVETDSSRLINNVDEINIQDFARAADEMTQSLIENCLAEEDLTSANADKPVIAISRIKNETNMRFDTDLLVKRIRTNLNRTKTVYTTTTVNLKKGEDPLAEEALLIDEAIEEDSKPLVHDYSLSGKIIEVTTRTDNLRQSTYEFQLTLSDRRGLAVWEEIKNVTKQGKKATVGF